MHNNPSPSELIAAVKSFIDDTAAPNLSGHAAFHARVASNVLATLLRDLDTRSAAESREAGRLKDLLSQEAPLAELNAELCRKIQAGDMTIQSPGLLDHLKATAIDQLKVDQPKYSGLKTALEHE